MTKKLWSGRFKKTLHPEAELYTESFSFDNRLFEYDIIGSVAHAQTLARAKIISSPDAKKIIKGLKSIKLKKTAKAEDVHSYIENELVKKIGNTAKCIHAGRSRNDQVQLDTRLYLKDTTNHILRLVTDFQKAAVNLAEKNKDVIMPGFTHLQHAQPVLLAHHLLAYVEMAERDKERFKDLLKRVDVLPLGSGAIAGSNLPLDRKYTAKILGFSKITANSIDAVSDRDYLAEFLSCAAITGIHLSRLAEELVLWSSKEFSYIDIDESLCTGSSLMPQKKNPDTAELLRGKSARLIGNLTSMLSLLKSLPLAYNRDLQEDKPPVFDSADTIIQSLSAACLLMRNIKIRKDNLLKAAEEDDSILATDLAERLVSDGIPFRKAHETVGKLVRHAQENRLRLDEIKGAARSAHSREDLTLKNSVKGKKTIGSTNPVMVANNLKKWKTVLGQ